VIAVELVIFVGLIVAFVWYSRRHGGLKNTVKRLLPSRKPKFLSNLGTALLSPGDGDSPLVDPLDDNDGRTDEDDAILEFNSDLGDHKKCVCDLVPPGSARRV
jgi:hypothetical protein